MCAVYCVWRSTLRAVRRYATVEDLRNFNCTSLIVALRRLRSRNHHRIEVFSTSRSIVAS